MGRDQPLLKVKVFFSVAMGKDPFECTATSVSSNNKLGRFDVLPRHINFITLIFDEVEIKTREEKINHKFKKGVLKVNADEIDIFLGL